MKITKNRLKRIIKEEAKKMFREGSYIVERSNPLEDPGTQMVSRPGKIKQNYFPDTDDRGEAGEEFGEAAIDEMQYVIEMFLDDDEPAIAKALKVVFSTALHDKSATGEPSQKLIKMYQNLDDVARGEIPYEIGSWIRGEEDY